MHLEGRLNWFEADLFLIYFGGLPSNSHQVVGNMTEWIREAQGSLGLGLMLTSFPHMAQPHAAPSHDVCRTPFSVTRLGTMGLLGICLVHCGCIINANRVAFVVMMPFSSGSGSTASPC